MIGMQRVGCLLWDFGDTLCDERSLWRESPEWMAMYKSFDDKDGIGAAWHLGDVETAEVVAHLAERTSMARAEIHAHLLRTDLFDFFPFTYEFFRARHLPQSIVTVNPSLFRDMATQLGFEAITESIVISGEEGTIDKGVLCEIAVQRGHAECQHNQALLIDNKPENLDAWVKRGGIGYLYTTDAAFRRDVSDGIDGLLTAQNVSDSME